MQCYRLLLPRRMTIQDFLDHAQETRAADLVAPDEYQEVVARWVYAFDVPDSELKSLVLWVKAVHWAFPVGFLVGEVEYPGALQLHDGDYLPLDLSLERGELHEALTPEDLQLAEEAAYEFIDAMQGS